MGFSLSIPNAPLTRINEYILDGTIDRYQAQLVDQGKNMSM